MTSFNFTLSFLNIFFHFDRSELHAISARAKMVQLVAAQRLQRHILRKFQFGVEFQVGKRAGRNNIVLLSGFVSQSFDN